MNVITGRYPALAFPLFRRYWLASFASVGATQLVILGQGWLIFELSGSALQLGVLGAAAALPNILMTLLGGVIADRFDRRRILMATSLITTGLLSMLAWLDYSGLVEVWHVLTIAAGVSLISGLDWPARASIFPLLLERSAFMSAVALNAFIWQATRMAMPALGGIVIAAARDTWPIFAASAVGFFVMFWVMSSIRIQVAPAAVSSPLEQLREGMRFIWTQDLFRWLLGLTFVGMFFALSYVQIMPVFADLLGSDERGYGLLLSAGGLGSVVGTLLIGGVQQHQHFGRLMLGSAVLSVFAVFAFAAATTLQSFIAALLCAFIAAGFGSVYQVSSMTVMQLKVPDALRGRVMGIHTIGYSLVPLGGLFLGSLAEISGAPLALMVGGALYLGAILVVWQVQAPIRELDGADLESVDQPLAAR